MFYTLPLPFWQWNSPSAYKSGRGFHSKPHSRLIYTLPLPFWQWNSPLAYKSGRGFHSKPRSRLIYTLPLLFWQRNSPLAYKSGRGFHSKPHSRLIYTLPLLFPRGDFCGLQIPIDKQKRAACCGRKQRAVKGGKPLFTSPLDINQIMRMRQIR